MSLPSAALIGSRARVTNLALLNSVKLVFSPYELGVVPQQGGKGGGQVCYRPVLKGFPEYLGALQE
jgi:hypothetical protein